MTPPQPWLQRRQDNAYVLQCMDVIELQEQNLQRVHIWISQGILVCAHVRMHTYHVHARLW